DRSAPAGEHHAHGDGRRLRRRLRRDSRGPAVERPAPALLLPVGAVPGRLRGGRDRHPAGPGRPGNQLGPVAGRVDTRARTSGSPGRRSPDGARPLPAGPTAYPAATPTRAAIRPTARPSGGAGHPRAAGTPAVPRGALAPAPAS